MRFVTPLLLLGALLGFGVTTTLTTHAVQVVRVAVHSVGNLLPNAQPCQGQPTLQYSYADPPRITSGQITVLYWGRVGNADSAYLQYPNGQRQRIETPGAQPVNPTQNSTYLVIADCGGNEQTWSIPVTVKNAPGCNGTPKMNGFTANPQTIQTGETGTLSWGPVSNAQYVQLSSQNQGGAGVPAPGSVGVQPHQTTTYYLTAWCQSNTAQLQITINVNNPPPTIPPPPENVIPSIVKIEQSHAGQLVVGVDYFWNGQDAPTTLQVTGYDRDGNPIRTSKPVPIEPNIKTSANLTVKPNSRNIASVTACMLGKSGIELVCQSIKLK